MRASDESRKGYHQSCALDVRKHIHPEFTIDCTVIIISTPKFNPKKKSDIHVSKKKKGEKHILNNQTEREREGERGGEINYLNRGKMPRIKPHLHERRSCCVVVGTSRSKE